MKSKALLTAALLCSAAIPASAGPIFVNGLLTPAVTLTLVSPDSVMASTPGFSGLTTHDADAPGTADFGAFSGTFGPQGPANNYPGLVDESFSYLSADGALTGLITWTKLIYNPASSGEPQFFGAMEVLSSTLADFVAGTSGDISGTFPTPCSLASFDSSVCPPLDMVVTLFEGSEASPGGGMVTPHGNDVPEPSSLMLMLSMLAGALVCGYLSAGGYRAAPGKTAGYFARRALSR